VQQESQGVAAVKLIVLRVIRAGDTTELSVEAGTNLRQALLAAGFSPYTALTRRANCGGRGLCATCGVWIDAGEPKPQHWHDRVGYAFGYPRLSCQITVDHDMTVHILDDKIIWGRPRPRSR
jgi:ferredoxin